MKTVVVTLCDQRYIGKAKQTISEVQSVGKWTGDIVLLAVDFIPDPIPGVEIRHISHINLDALFEAWKLHPIRPMDDNRHHGKVYQWDKLQVFDTWFKRWECVIFLDAGIRVFNDMNAILSLPWKGSFLAPDDSDPYDNGRRFEVQLDLNANPEVTERLFQEFPTSILTRPYFLNCIFMFDTALIDKVSCDDLVNAMNAYPICMCNEMGILNLLFTFKLGVWKPFPQRVGSRYLFGWCEANYRDSPRASDFHFLKYSITG